MSEPIIIAVKQGKLKGKIGTDYKNGKYFSFQGIPYAKPPIGELRFKSPVQPENWEGIRDATKEASCSLGHNFFNREQIDGSEDCLYLNVYTPQLLTTANDNELLPVMFWIHGGGFIMGSGNTDLYGPEYLMTKNVVLVTINYRLGILGLLSLEDSSLGVPGNASFKDMVFALKWVQENIQNFGGDPTNVTIFGESAGGASVNLLLVSPLAKGLFHRAILQSGCAMNTWVKGSKGAKKIADVLNMNTASEREVLEYLKGISAEEILNIQDKIEDRFECNQIRPFGAVVENPSNNEPAFLHQTPLEIIASGNYNKVPVMIGYNNNEGIFAEILEIQQTGSSKVPTDLTNQIAYYYLIPKGSEASKRFANKLKEFYFDNKQSSDDIGDQYLKLVTDSLFWRGIYLTVRLLLNNNNLPIYLYRFTADTELNVMKRVGKSKRSGASHLDEIGYLFTTEFTPKFDLNSVEGKAVETMITIWTNFAKNANPNSDQLDVTWKPVEKDCLNFLDIGEKLVVGQDPDMDRMNFWNGIHEDPILKTLK